MENEKVNNSKINKQNENRINRVKLYLEGSTNKKIEISDVKFFSNTPSEPFKKELSYKVWLYSPEILQDANKSHVKDISTPGFSYKGFPKVIKCKLGHVNLEEVIKSNQQASSQGTEQFSQTKSQVSLQEREKIQIVLAEILIDNFKCHIVNEEIDITTVDVTKLDLNDGVVYLGKPESARLNNEINIENKSAHVFAVKDFSRIDYISIVTFSTDNESIQCSNCSQVKDDLRYYYCHNDKQYFCGKCDEEVHNKPNAKIFAKHKRTYCANFSITHQTTCNQHLLKPFEFYCLDCKAVYCIMCLTIGDHKLFQNHKVNHLNDVFKSIENQSKSLMERANQINTSISLELDKKEKSAKDLNKMITDKDNEINEKKKNLIEEVLNEARDRTAYIASISAEASRIISELDGKINYIKHLHSNVDHSTYLSMSNSFIDHIQKDVLHNIDLLLATDLDKISDPIIPPIEKNTPTNTNKKIKSVKFNSDLVINE